jgi:hypothetical protein
VANKPWSVVNLERLGIDIHEIYLKPSRDANLLEPFRCLEKPPFRFSTKDGLSIDWLT